jgi:hypothetical protein
LAAGFVPAFTVARFEADLALVLIVIESSSIIN